MSENQISAFDRLLGSLEGLTGVTKTKPSTLTTVFPLIGASMTAIVQTYRQRDVNDEAARARDYVFVQVVTGEQTVRFVLPPDAADAIARQRESLNTKSRKRAAQASAAARKASGTPNPLLDPAVRAKALAARKAKRKMRRKGGKA